MGIIQFNSGKIQHQRTIRNTIINCLNINYKPMKFLIRYFAIIALLQILSLHAIAQNNNSILDRQVSIDVRDQPLKEILKTISTETGIGFSYSDDLVLLKPKTNH
jgi:hypothetical protein